MPKISLPDEFPPVNPIDGKSSVLRNRKSRPIVFMFGTRRSIPLQFAVGEIRIYSHSSVRSRDGEIAESHSVRHTPRGDASKIPTY